MSLGSPGHSVPDCPLATGEERSDVDLMVRLPVTAPARERTIRQRHDRGPGRGRERNRNPARRGLVAPGPKDRPLPSSPGPTRLDAGCFRRCQQASSSSVPRVSGSTPACTGDAGPPIPLRIAAGSRTENVVADRVAQRDDQRHIDR